ncbi:Heat shock factor protein 2 [Tulasnella sp. 417]|nr:Heat shock factor protein 2 [Tulasnella sp. 417]
MSRSTPTPALQYGVRPGEYLLPEPWDFPAEHPPPQPGISESYPRSFILSVNEGWGHQRDYLLRNGYVAPRNGESVTGAASVHFEEPGPFAGPSNLQQMPSAHDQPSTTVDNEDHRPRGPFPCQLHWAAKLIYWDREGRIIVPDFEALQDAKLISKYFNHNNWSSVVRQLDNYGFAKDNRAEPGGTRHVYYHRNFAQGRKDLLSKIKPKPKGRDSGKALAASVRKGLEKKLSCSEKEKKELEARNEDLTAENRILKGQLREEKKVLEARNEYLTAENRMLKDQLLDMMLRFDTLQLQFVHGAAPAVLDMPPNSFHTDHSYKDITGWERIRSGWMSHAQYVQRLSANGDYRPTAF